MKVAYIGSPRLARPEQASDFEKEAIEGDPNASGALEYGRRCNGMYKINLEIEQLPEGPFLGTSPDLPGLVVQADTVEEVLRLAPDVAHDLIAVMVETQQKLPRGVETVTTPWRVPVLVPA
jgi:predicted RNase H-like HicB family nuclease